MYRLLKDRNGNSLLTVTEQPKWSGTHPQYSTLNNPNERILNIRLSTTQMALNASSIFDFQQPKWPGTHPHYSTQHEEDMLIS